MSHVLLNLIALCFSPKATVKGLVLHILSVLVYSKIEP